MNSKPAKPTSIPLNPAALEAAAKALLAVQQPEVSAEYAWNVQFEDGRDELRNEARAAVSAYLAVAQPVVNSVKELVTTRAGLALANSAFNEGLSAGIKACNESLEGEPFVKPVSPYRPEVNTNGR